MIRKVTVNCPAHNKVITVECYCKNYNLFSDNKLVKIYRSRKCKSCLNCEYICPLYHQFLDDAKRINV